MGLEVAVTDAGTEEAAKRCAPAAPLDAKLSAFLSDEDLHPGVRVHLEQTGCRTVARFRCWVDAAADWTSLLQGVGLEGLERRHLAHVKERWQAAQVQWDVQAAHVQQGVLAPLAVQSPQARPALSMGNAFDQSANAEFWKGLVTQRRTASDGFSSPRSLEDLSVQDLADLLTCSDSIRVGQCFDRFDTSGDQLVQASEVGNALEFLGFRMSDGSAKSVVQHVNRVKLNGKGPENALTRDAFELMVKWLRLAELYTPSAGAFQFSCSQAVDEAGVFCVDYNPDFCRVTWPLRDESGLRFFFGCRSKPPDVAGDPVAKGGRCIRWVHMDATAGLDRLTLLRLAVKYNLHPLAIDDVLDNRTGTKIDRYGTHIVVSADILGLASVAPSKSKGPPARVRIHRSHVTIFLAGPPEVDTMLTVHQERRDTSSWLEMWHRGRENVQVPDDGGLWRLLRDDLQLGRGGDLGGGKTDRRPPKRMREEKSDYLLYEVLRRIVGQLRPIALAYAKRLGHLHQKPVNKLTQDDMDEIAEIKLETYDFVRSVRPMKQVVKHCIDDQDFNNAARMYMEDVRDAIDCIMEDIAHLEKMAETLESAHERYRDKQMSDTLYILSILSTIFLPLQFTTGWYGMNFVHMPELHWDYGYQYFWCLQLTCLVMSGCAIAIVTHGCPTPRALRRCTRRHQGKVYCQTACESDGV